MEIKFKKGQRVWWNDPDGETSAYYVIETDIEKEMAEAREGETWSIEEIMADFPILICNEHSEATVFAHELEPEYNGNDHNDLRIRHSKLTTDMHTFILRRLRENSGAIKLSVDLKEGEGVELPAPIPLYSKERFHPIVLTEVRLDESSNIPVIYASGRNETTGKIESDFYILPDSYAEVVWFIVNELDL